MAFDKVKRKRQRNKVDSQKTVICVVLFLLMQISVSGAASGTGHNSLYYPDEYEGKTIIFENAKIGGAIGKNSYTGYYCLHVEINGQYIPGLLYKSQLNFVVVSSELADRLATALSRNLKNHVPSHEINLMNHLNRGEACSVRLTANIQNLSGYWMAVVSKIEFYGKKGTITNTVK